MTLPEHTVTAFGYIIEPNIELSSEIRKERIIGFENWIKGIIVHDDATGPYRILPISKHQREYFNDLCVSNLLHENTLEDVDGIIIPSFEKIYLVGQFVDMIVKGCLDETLPKVLDLAKNGNKHARNFLISLNNNPPVIRTYCIPSTSFQHHLYSNPLLIDKDLGMDPELRKIYQKMKMPKHIWIAEVTTSTHMSKEDENERKVFGEIILDSTANPHAPSILAIHLPGILGIRDMINNKNKIDVKELPHDKPYTYPREFL